MCRHTQLCRAPARAVDTAVISDTCTFLRGKCKRFPVILGQTAAGGNTVVLYRGVGCRYDGACIIVK